MTLHLKRSLARKVCIGRRGVPLWTLALAAVLVVGVAGQAVGPVLLGRVGGSAGVTVGQSLVLTSASSAYANAGANDAMLTINDEGTGFTAALELNVGGEDNLIALNIRNSSGKPANATLTLEVPEQLAVEAEATIGTDVEESQLSGSAWLLTLTVDSEDEDLEITVKARPDAPPGFYTIKGKLLQTGG